MFARPLHCRYKHTVRRRFATYDCDLRHAVRVWVPDDEALRPAVLVHTLVRVVGHLEWMWGDHVLWVLSTRIPLAYLCGPRVFRHNLLIRFRDPRRTADFYVIRRERKGTSILVDNFALVWLHKEGVVYSTESHSPLCCTLETECTG